MRFLHRRVVGRYTSFQRTCRSEYYSRALCLAVFRDGRSHIYRPRSDRKHNSIYTQKRQTHTTIRYVWCTAAKVPVLYYRCYYTVFLINVAEKHYRRLFPLFASPPRHEHFGPIKRRLPRVVNQTPLFPMTARAMTTYITHVYMYPPPPLQFAFICFGQEITHRVRTYL